MCNSSDAVTNRTGVGPRNGRDGSMLYVCASVSWIWPLAEIDVLEPGSAPTGISC